jgi:hypothetical protein
VGGESLELIDELAQSAGVVEPGPVAFGLGGAESFGDCFGADFADPGRVGAVAVLGVAVTAARGGATAGGALHQASGKAEVELGDFGQDLALAGLGLL